MTASGGVTFSDNTNQTSAASMTLLKASNGTTTNASAENVDTVSISGLTAKDTIVIYLNGDAVTQQTASVLLYNSTDAVTMKTLSFGGGTAWTAGQQAIGTITVRQSQSSATNIYTMSSGAKGTLSETNGTPDANASTFTTAWTGSWTLALRQTGVTAGGTFRWSWSVYKVAGQ